MFENRDVASCNREYLFFFHIQRPLFKYTHPNEKREQEKLVSRDTLA